MGLGPSYQPTCDYCNCSYKVNYICKIYDKPNELAPWWKQTSLYDNESLYWACTNCIKAIPMKYRCNFKYVENYQCHGM